MVRVGCRVQFTRHGYVLSRRISLEDGLQLQLQGERPSQPCTRFGFLRDEGLRNLLEGVLQLERRSIRLKLMFRKDRCKTIDFRNKLRGMKRKDGYRLILREA